MNVLNTTQWYNLFVLIFLFIYLAMPGLPWWLSGKESACNAGDLGLIPGLGRSPGGGHVNPLQYSCLENPDGQRSQVGYSPRGLKESDTTERLSTCQVSAVARGIFGRHCSLWDLQLCPANS